MAVVIRLSRHGVKKKPIYRIVVADEDYPRDGRFLEVLGTYNPKEVSGTAKFDLTRLNHWVSQGAKPSTTVAQIVKRSAVIAAA